MKRCMTFAVGSMACFFLAGFVAVASEEENPAGYTVADFAVDLAKLITHKPDFQPEEAIAHLQALGVDLSDGRTSELDEARFVDVLNRFGVSLTTSNPDRQMAGDKASRFFRMFDRNDGLFSGEVFRICSGSGVSSPGVGHPGLCIFDADCTGGSKCREIQSIKCKGGANDGDLCHFDSDCPSGVCQAPPGQLRKIGISSPSE